MIFDINFKNKTVLIIDFLTFLLSKQWLTDNSINKENEYIQIHVYWKTKIIKKVKNVVTYFK